MKLVVLSPHRGDAAFALGLAVSGWLASGHDVTVVNCFTRTGYAPFSDVDALHSNDRVSFASALRRREDVAWNKMLGGKLHFHDLDLLDAPLRLVCTIEEAYTVDIRPGDRAVARIAGAIAKFARTSQPGTLAFAVPLAVGNHIDHRVVRQASVEAGLDSLHPLAYYEDLPFAAQLPEGSVAGALAMDGEALPPCFAPALPGTVEDAIHRKKRMVECYDSQLDSEEVQMVATFAERYAGRERLWPNASWLAAKSLCAGEAPAA